MAADKSDKPWLFKPGQSGNPEGRPKGARNKFAEQFFVDLQALWKEEGAQALKDALKADPMGFVRAAASVLPKELNINQRNVGDLTDEQIDLLLAILAEFGPHQNGAGSGEDLPTKH